MAGWVGAKLMLGVGHRQDISYVSSACVYCVGNDAVVILCFH